MMAEGLGVVPVPLPGYGRRILFDAAARFPSAEAGRCCSDVAGLHLEPAVEGASHFLNVDEHPFPDFRVGVEATGSPLVEATFRNGTWAGSKKGDSTFFKAAEDWM